MCTITPDFGRSIASFPQSNVTNYLETLPVDLVSRQIAPFLTVDDFINVSRAYADFDDPNVTEEQMENTTHIDTEELKKRQALYSRQLQLYVPFSDIIRLHKNVKSLSLDLGNRYQVFRTGEKKWSLTQMFSDVLGLHSSGREEHISGQASASLQRLFNSHQLDFIDRHPSWNEVEEQSIRVETANPLMVDVLMRDLPHSSFMEDGSVKNSRVTSRFSPLSSGRNFSICTPDWEDQIQQIQDVNDEFHDALASLEKLEDLEITNRFLQGFDELAEEDLRSHLNQVGQPGAFPSLQTATGVLRRIPAFIHGPVNPIVGQIDLLAPPPAPMPDEALGGLAEEE